MSADTQGRAAFKWDVVAGVLMMAIAATFLYAAWNLRPVPDPVRKRESFAD